MSQAYYHSTIGEFIGTNQNEILGKLNKGATSFASQWTITTTSWDSSLDILKKACLELKDLNPLSNGWHILLEYEIPRLLSRADIIILADDLIFVIEFKYERNKYELEDIHQVEDYKSDLSNFHLQSRERIIIPVLLAPKAKSVNPETSYQFDQLNCIKTNENNFAEIVHNLYKEFHDGTKSNIDPYQWEQSQYQPTPTIIQAAKALFAGHKVENISKYGADSTNLTLTSNYLIRVINYAKSEKKKVVCFVTGVPGAGKTLVGLNIVNLKNNNEEEVINAAYFSGNGPLIKVLQEALTRDDYERKLKLYKLKKIEYKPNKKNSFNEVKTKIQNLHQFIKDGI